MNIATPITIEKDLLPTLRFPQDEVLTDPAQLTQRRIEAQRAVKLGNNYKGKVRIVFEDNDSIKMVETTIWGVTGKYLILKSGMLIPIKRVHEIII
jgi:hypothetical protein